MQHCWTALLRENIQVPEIQCWEYCSKLKAQSSKLKAQSSKLKAQSSKLKAQGSKLKAQSSQLLHSHRLLCRGCELCSFSILADSTLLYRLIWAKLTDSTQQLCRIDRSSNSCEDWELSSLEIPADRMQRCWTALLRKNVQVPEIQYWECWGQNLIWAKLTASTQSDLRQLQWCPQAETQQNQHRRAQLSNSDWQSVEVDFWPNR